MDKDIKKAGRDPSFCSCKLREMKKLKLQLKDEITRLSRELEPVSDDEPTAPRLVHDSAVVDVGTTNPTIFLKRRLAG